MDDKSSTGFQRRKWGMAELNLYEEIMSEHLYVTWSLIIVSLVS